MKKFIYLCALMMLSINLMAQIDTCDHNWNVIVFDHFDQPNRYFDNTFQESNNGQWRWISFTPRLYPSGVTKWNYNKKTHDTIYNHQYYRWDHCIFDDDYEMQGTHGVLKVFSDFISTSTILCDDTLLPPPSFGKSFRCDTLHKRLHYFSGMIESLPGGYNKLSEKDLEDDDRSLPGRFRYGYFEIKCKVPVHRGASVGFWLWDVQKNQYYEAIDIFEYSWLFTDSNFGYPGRPFGSPRVYSSGVHYSPTSDTNARQFGRVYPKIPNNEEDLSGWHTFGCEWLPERVTFYRDGVAFNEVTGRENIPSHALTLKTTYSLDEYACDTIFWQGTDTLFVDYIKVYQLSWDCDEDKIIACQTDLDTLTFKVKKSYNITSSLGNVKVYDTCNMTFRATDYFEITGPFQTDLGGQMAVIMQECPDAINKESIINKKDEP